MSRIDKFMGGWFWKIVKDWALWVTFVLSLAIVLFGDEKILRHASINVGLAEVAIGTALLGIVLAGLAILIIFLDEKYIALLEKVPPGFDADIWPFKWVALIAITCAALGMLLIIIGCPPVWIFKLVFGLSLWSFSYLLWAMFDLVKFIAGHAKARVEQIKKKR